MEFIIAYKLQVFSQYWIHQQFNVTPGYLI